jgi:heme/copper-type cytochrome/quinol oxidase subunit 3
MRPQNFKIGHALRIAGIVLGLMLVASAVTLMRIPAGQEIPIQYDLHGNPVRYASALVAVALIPVVLVFSSAMFVVAGRRKANQQPIDMFIWLFTVLVLGAGHAYLVIKALERI